MKNRLNQCVQFIIVVCLAHFSTGCLLAAAGAGAEGAYVATQEDRTASETLDDQRITASVKTKFIADSDVAARNINVDTFKQVVTLRGFVRTSKEERKAIELASSVSGVKNVNSKLEIQ